jgi:hypothetical protein
MVEFRQDYFKLKVKHYVWRSRNSFILFGIGKNCLRSEKTPLLYQFTRRVIKLTSIIEEYHFYQLLTQFYPVFFPQS